MNKQVNRKNGAIVSRGIEWTDYTWNPIKGGFHACQWEMPDGSIANCYAEDVAWARNHWREEFPTNENEAQK
jgi:protein gp37